MIKKIISLCLCALLFCSVLSIAPTAKAQTVSQDYTVKVTSACAHTGATASVNIVLGAEEAHDFLEMQCLLVYDKTRLELITEETDAHAPVAAKGFTFAWATDTFEEYTHAHTAAFTVKTEDGEVATYGKDTHCLTLSFRVKENAPLGDAYIKLIELSDQNATTYFAVGDGMFADASYTDGKISVLPDEYLLPGTGLGQYSVSVSIDGVRTSYYVSDGDTRLPGAMQQNGRITVAWKNRGKYYLPGTPMVIEGNLSLEAVTIAVPETVKGAAIKISPNPNNTALRFKAMISAEDLDNLIALFGDENVLHGMLMAPQQNIDFVGGCTFEAFAPHVKPYGKLPYIDEPLEDGEFYEQKDGKYVLTGLVEGYTDNNLRSGVRMNAVAYVTVTIGEESFTVYGADDFTAARDVGYVVNQALNAYYSDRALYTDDQVEWLLALQERCSPQEE